MRFLYVALFLGILSCSTKEQITEAEQWQVQAEGITIIRDDFGVPHIYGKTDADAVFGLLYAQCEDDFNRVEQNYIWAIGRLAEVDGEVALYSVTCHMWFMAVAAGYIRKFGAVTVCRQDIMHLVDGGSTGTGNYIVVSSSQSGFYINSTHSIGIVTVKTESLSFL